MNVKIQNNDNIDGSWEAEFNFSNTGDMKFCLNNKTLMEFCGTELGMLKESQGFNDYTRIHKSEKTDWQWVDYKTVHPFGSEPAIQRKWEQAGNHIKVITDLTLYSETPMTHINVDCLRLPGKWSRIVLIKQKVSGSLDIELEEYDVNELTGSGLKFSYIPLAIVFFKEDGTALEIGSGYDLWRWNKAEQFGAKSEFSLTVTDENILFERKPFVWDDEYAFPRNNLRFTWYFAWSGVNRIYKMSDEVGNKLKFYKNKLIFDKTNKSNFYTIDNCSWPAAALSEGMKNPVPCFTSRQTANLLKRWLRSLFNKLEKTDGDVALCNLEPHLCLNSSHMERSGRQDVLHWDYFYIMSLWEWANKYLGETDNNFQIYFKKDSLFKVLPSAIGLSDEHI